MRRVFGLSDRSCTVEAYGASASQGQNGAHDLVSAFAAAGAPVLYGSHMRNVRSGCLNDLSIEDRLMSIDPFCRWNPEPRCSVPAWKREAKRPVGLVSERALGYEDGINAEIQSV